MDQQIEEFDNDINYSNPYACALAKLALIFYDWESFAGENVDPKKTANFLINAAKEITRLENRLNRRQ